eukprot:1157218-Pelagomonas_calceolata.AAC.1
MAKQGAQGQCAVAAAGRPGCVHAKCCGKAGRHACHLPAAGHQEQAPDCLCIAGGQSACLGKAGDHLDCLRRAGGQSACLFKAGGQLNCLGKAGVH